MLKLNFGCRIGSAVTILLLVAGIPQSVLSADLPVLLALDEGSGDVALDSGGAGNDGALIGNPIFSTDTADGSAYSLYFDRLNDQIDLGVLDASGSQFTLAAWTKAESFPGSKSDPHIISKTSGSSLSNHVFMLSTVAAGSGVRLRARVRIGGTTATLRAAPGYDLVEGQWYHTAATYDGVNLRLYLDGVEVGSRSLSGAIDQDPAVPVSVGSRAGGGNYFHGLIDDVRILDEALTVSQLQDIAAGNSSNGLPVAVTETYSVIEDNSLTVDILNGVLANDTDPDGDSLLSNLVAGATNGTVTLDPDGSFVYTPESDFSGLDSFVYRATDGAGFSDDTLVTLSVESVNDSPIALDDSYTTAYESSLTANVLENDTDVDGDNIFAEMVSSVQSGDLSFQSNGSFSYSPDLGFSGLDFFTYITTDEVGAASDEATVSIVVNEPNSGNGANTLVNLPFEEGSGSVAFDSSGQGNDGQLLGNPVYTTATGNGSIYALNFDGTDDSVDLGVLDSDGSELTLAAWFKAESFSGNARDPRLISKASGSAANSHVFMLSTVKAGSGVRLRARLRIGGQTRTLRADPGSELVTGRWYHGAFTYDGALMRIYLDGELVGTQALSGEIDQDPTVSVAVGSQPGGGRHFDGSIDDVLIMNAALDDAQLQAIFTGVGANGLPVAGPDSYAVTEDQVLSVDQSAGVLTNDSDPENEALTAILVTDAANGSVSLNDNGSFVYTPVADFFGNDTYTYRASDGAGASGIATVTITVEAVNDQPQALDDSFVATFESELAGNVLINDLDIDGDSLTAEIVTLPQNGAFEFQDSGDFIYTPNAGFIGSDSFSYTAHDAVSASIAANVEIVVQDDMPPDPGSDYVVQLSFEEGTGITAFDSSGMNNNGMLVGDTRYEPSTNDGSGYSIRLDGNGDGVDLGNFDVVGSQLTLAAWIKADSFPGNARDPRIVSKANGNASSDHVFMLSTIQAGSGTRLRARLRVDGTTKTLRAQAGADLTIGQWHHVAATYDGVMLRLYIDGQEAGSTTMTGDIDQDPTMAVKVGGQPGGGNVFDGLIDDLRVVQRALSTSELQSLADGDSNQGGNAVPIARNDNYVTSVDTLLQVTVGGGLLFNDTDQENSPLTVLQVTPAVNGVLLLEPDGSFEYQPDSGYSGLESFDYTVSDGENVSNVATVFIDVGGSVANQIPRFQTGSVFFSKQTIDSDVDQTHYAGGADLDGDTDVDIVATDYVNGAVYLYRNNGDLSFTKTVLDGALAGAYPAHLGDADGDLDIDILAGGYLADTLVLYENDGLGNFSRQIIDDMADGIHSVVTVDLNQDGYIDLLTADQDAGDISWYQRSSNGSYFRHSIDVNTAKAKRADYADLNGDGHLDVIAASDGVNRVAWYENDGSENFTRRIIDSNLSAAYFVHPEDINSDGNVDIVAAGKLANDIVVYRNNGNGTFAKQIIDNNSRGARSVDTGDIDGDGDIDAVGNSLQGDTVSWYENVGSNSYNEHQLSTGTDSAPYSVVVVDVNLDSALDLLVASRDDDSISIYTNTRLHQISVPQGASFIIGANNLSSTDGDSTPAEIIYSVEATPLLGELLLDGAALVVGSSFTQAEVNQNRVSYAHHGQSASNDSFELSMTDLSGSGGEAATALFTVFVTD